jgi:glutamate-1-semialdehyde 2,1-aminomutase
MAAGIATLAELQPTRYAALESTADALATGLRQAAAAADRQVAISRVGSLLTVFFRPDLPTDATEAMTADRTAFSRFFGAMLDRGVLLPPSQFEAWFVSMAHGRAQIDATLAAASQAFLA